MKNIVRFRILPLMVVAVFLSVFIFSMSSVARQPNTSLLPADHGLPDITAGYRVLAVRTEETTLCWPPGLAIATIQVEAPTVDEALLTDWRSVHQELERLFPDSGIRWHVELADPSATFEGIVAVNARWNAHFTEHDCMRLGGIGSRDETPVVR